MIIQLLQKINLKKSFFSGLLFLLPTSSFLQAKEVNDYINYRNWYWYHDGIEDSNSFTHEQLFTLNAVNPVEGSNIPYFFEVCGKLNNALEAKKIGFDDIYSNTGSLHILLAQAFLLNKYDEEKVYGKILGNLKSIEGKEKTAHELLLEGQYLYKRILDQYIFRRKLVKDKKDDKNYNKWDEWEQENAKQFIEAWQQFFQKVEVTPEILLEASYTHEAIFGYLLNISKKQQNNESEKKNETYWLNQLFLNETFLSNFFAYHYENPYQKKVTSKIKKEIFKLINLDQSKGIDPLMKNDPGKYIPPTPFVQACWHDQEDALLLWRQIEQAKTEVVTDYLNTTVAENYSIINLKPYENALMAALYIGKNADAPIFKVELLKKLLQWEGVIVGFRHMHYFEKKVESNQKILDNRKNELDEIKTLLNNKYQKGRREVDREQWNKITSLKKEYKESESKTEEKIKDIKLNTKQKNRDINNLKNEATDLNSQIEEQKKQLNSLQNGPNVDQNAKEEKMKELQDSIKSKVLQINELNNQINQLNKHHPSKVHNLTQANQEKENKMNQLTNSIEDKKKNIDEQQKELDSQQALAQQKNTELSNLKDVYNNQDNELEKQKTALHDKVAEYDDLLKKHQNELEQEQKKYNNLVESVKKGDTSETLKKQLDQAQSNAAELNNDLNKNKDFLDEAKKKSTQLKSQFEQTQNTYIQINNNNEQLKNNIIKAEKQLEKVKASKIASDNLANVKKEINQLNLQLQKTRKEVKNLEKQLKKAKAKLPEKGAREASNRFNTALSNEVEELNNQLKEKKEVINKLEQELNKEKEKYTTIKRESDEAEKKINEMEREKGASNNNQASKVVDLEQEVKNYENEINNLQDQKTKLAASSKSSFGKLGGWILSVVLLTIAGLQAWYTTKIKQKLATAIDE